MLLGIGLGLAASSAASAQSALSGDAIRISRAAGAIIIDGDLSDEGWRGATRVETFYEISPGDNVEPPVKSVGYLSYDSRLFYAAFDLEDPDPSAIRAPLGDHDSVRGDSHDFAGLFLDPLDTGRTAQRSHPRRRRRDWPAAVRLCRAVQSVADRVAHRRRRHGRQVNRFRPRAAGARGDGESERNAPSDRPPRAGDHPEPEIPERRHTHRRERPFLTQRVSRLRSTYAFTSRLFTRVIVQYVSTSRDPLLSPTDAAAREGELSGSALLAYKFNWQSVMFVGYGDNRELNERERFEQVNRQFFVKISYALQR